MSYPTSTKGSRRPITKLKYDRRPRRDNYHAKRWSQVLLVKSGHQPVENFGTSKDRDALRYFNLFDF